MGDYISREKLWKKLDALERVDTGDETDAVLRVDALLAVENLSAADVRPVVRGKWQLLEGGAGRCPNCKSVLKDVWDYDRSDPFCRECGADMREGSAVQEQLNHEGTTRNGAENKMTYELYQLPSLEEVRKLMFLSWDQMQQNGYTIDPRRYECVYMGELESTNLKAELEALFRKFNSDLDKPRDYFGRSMSVSDVVVVRGQGKPRAFYCDCVGFKEIEWGMM